MTSNAKNIAVVTNELAGTGRALALRDNISQRLHQLHINHDCFTENWPDDFNGYSEVWVIGGDGTLNFFLNRYPFLRLPLSIFAGGSGNDFHWLLYGTMPWDQQVKHVLNATPQPVDAGICNGKIFMNSTGAGFDGAVVKSLQGKAKKKGKASFFSAVLRKIVLYKEHRYLVEADGVRVDGCFLIVSVMNGKRAGGGFYIAPGAEISDGLLDITLIHKLKFWQRLRYLPVVEKGKHAGRFFSQQYKLSKFSITSDAPMDAQLDGEYFSSTRIDIETAPGRFLFIY